MNYGNAKEGRDGKCYCTLGTVNHSLGRFSPLYTLINKIQLPALSFRLMRIRCEAPGPSKYPIGGKNYRYTAATQQLLCRGSVQIDLSPDDVPRQQTGFYYLCLVTWLLLQLWIVLNMSTFEVPEEPTGHLSITSKMMSLNSPVAKEWLSLRRKSVRPWSEFVDTKKFKVPAGVTKWTQRSVKNIEHYQTNYLFVFIGLIIYCIITSPLLLIAIAVFLGACYIIHIKNEQQKIKIMGHELSYAQQYGVAALLSFPLFFLAGAGASVFWVLGVSFFLVGLHASFHMSLEEEATEEPFMETV